MEMVWPYFHNFCSNMVAKELKTIKLVLKVDGSLTFLSLATEMKTILM